MEYTGVGRRKATKKTSRQTIKTVSLIFCAKAVTHLLSIGFPHSFYEQPECMEMFYEKFMNFGSVEISDYSHNEKGYNATRTGEIISYAYTMDIELD